MMRRDGRCSLAQACRPLFGESRPVTSDGKLLSGGFTPDALLNKQVKVFDSTPNKFDVKELTRNGVMPSVSGARQCQLCDPRGGCSLPSWCARAGGLFPRSGNAKTTAAVTYRMDLVAECSITSAATLVFTLLLSSSSPLSEPSVLSSGEGFPKLLDETGRKDDKEEDKRSIELDHWRETLHEKRMKVEAVNLQTDEAPGIVKSSPEYAQPERIDGLSWETFDAPDQYQAGGGACLSTRGRVTCWSVAGFADELHGRVLEQLRSKRSPTMRDASPHTFRVSLGRNNMARSRFNSITFVHEDGEMAPPNISREMVVDGNKSEEMETYLQWSILDQLALAVVRKYVTMPVNDKCSKASGFTKPREGYPKRGAVHCNRASPDGGSQQSVSENSKSVSLGTHLSKTNSEAVSIGQHHRGVERKTAEGQSRCHLRRIHQHRCHQSCRDEVVCRQRKE